MAVVARPIPATVGDENDVLEAVIRSRLDVGVIPPSVDAPFLQGGLLVYPVYPAPVYRVCVAREGGADPSDELLRRFKAPYEVRPISRCDQGSSRIPYELSIGAVRWLDHNTAEVSTSGLGRAGLVYRAERVKKGWRAGVPGGIVSDGSSTGEREALRLAVASYPLRASW
jgi:hypothetical protein